MSHDLPAGIRIRHDRGTVQASLWLGTGPDRRRYQRTIARLDECRELLDDPPAFARFIAARREDALRKLSAEAPARRSLPGRARLAATWQEWMDASRHRLAPGTLAYYARTGTELLAALGDIPVHTFAGAHVDAFLEALRQPRGTPPHTLSAGSINIRLQNLGAFLRWCHERDLLAKVPRIRRLPMRHKLPHILPPEDLARLIARARSNRLHLRALMVALGTGMRRSEVFHLRWDQVDFAAGKIYVRFQTRFAIKERREKAPFMPAFLHAFLAAEAPPPGSPERYLLDDGTGRIAYWHPNVLTAAFRRYYDRLGIPDERRPKAFHGFRAQYITALYNDHNQDPAVIAQLVGHANITTTLSYLARTTDRAREAVRHLQLPVAEP